MGPTLRRPGFAVAMVVAVVACRQLVGIGDAPPAGAATVDSGGVETGPDAPMCGIAYAGDACEACLESSCCAEATACSRSEPCGAAEKCLGACGGDPACRARCVQGLRVGTDPATPAFESCMVRACATPCGLFCGGVGEVAPPDAAVACQQCYQGQGCQTLQDCISDPACAAYAICTIEALTPVELAACPPPGDGGVDAATLYGLANAYCATACGLGSHWSCVGQVGWPPGVGGDLTIALSVVDGPTLKSVPGVTAKVCNSSDPACTGPSATGTTGADGTVSLVQQRDAGPIYTNGYIDLSDGGIVPEVFFWSFPLSQSPASLRVTTVTPGELADLGLTPDPSNGDVYVQGFDCRQDHGLGMTFALTPAASSQIFYEQGGTFAPGLTGTDSTGGAVFVNAPAGPMGLTLTASVPTHGGPIGKFPLFVRPGGLAQVFALPQP